MAVPGDGERLAILDRVHDLLGPGPQIALGDLRLSSHTPSIACGSTV